jgi:BASS family bile acid:Na+ symporter
MMAPSPLAGMDVLGLKLLGVNLADISTTALIVIMFTMGLELRPIDFRRIGQHPLPIAVGLGCQLILGPLAAFGLAYALHPPMPIAVGLVLLACCPSAATSAFFTFLARGEVAISVTLTAISGPIVTFTLPILVNLALTLFGGRNQAIHLPVLRAMTEIATLIVAPVIVGMGLRALAPRFAAATGRIAAKVCFVFVVGIMAVLLVYLWPRLPALLAATGAVTLGLNLIMLLGGFIAARALKTNEAQSRAISIEIGIHNFILAVVISLAILRQPDFALVPITYLFVMYATVFAFIGYCRLVRDRRPGLPSLESPA